MSSDLLSKYCFKAADATQVGASLTQLKNNTEIKRAEFPARRPNESQENEKSAIFLFEASRVPCELYKTGHGTLFSLSKFFCQF